MRKTRPTFFVVVWRSSGGFFRRFLSSSPAPALKDGGETLERNGTLTPVRDGEVGRPLVPFGGGNKPPSRNGLPAPLAGVLSARLRRSWYRRLKYALDFLMALLILVLSAPVILVAMLLVKLTSRGPALYKQTRVGLNGVPFTIYKIRSMTYQCETLTGARWATPGDTRVTAVGKVLRKIHVDELPQLWNVLRGEMSLIGPRPERPEFVPQLEKAIPLYRTRLLVRPGLTGLAQVQLPPDTNLDSVRVKLAYDLWYVRHVGFVMDLRILLATAAKLIGLPFGLIRRIMFFARRATIQQSYNDLTAVAAEAQPPCAQTA